MIQIERVFFVTAVFSVLYCVGCGTESSISAQSKSGTAPTTQSLPKNDKNIASPIPQPAEVALTLVSWDDVQKQVAANKGKVVVLDLWSTWCEPCVKEFPHFVALQDEFPHDLVCLSLNCNFIGDDSLQEELKSVREFLAKHPGKAKHLMSQESDETLYKKVGISSIPVALVYDRTGKLRKRFDNESNEFGEAGFNYEKHIRPLVRELIAEKP
jgi:thiol-disulfide isomerase/thioredoxin